MKNGCIWIYIEDSKHDYLWYEKKNDSKMVDLRK